MKKFFTSLADNLDIDSNERNEIKNTLLYSLYMQDFVRDEKKTKRRDCELIDFALKETWDRFTTLFSPPFSGDFSSFLGQLKPLKHKSPQSLSSNITELSFFENIVKHHLIISSYIAIRSSYASDTTISCYYSALKMKNVGFDVALKEKYLTPNTIPTKSKFSFVRMKETNEVDRNVAKNYAYSYRKIFKEGFETSQGLYPINPEEFNSTLSKSALKDIKKTNTKIPLRYFEYYDFLKDNRKKTKYIAECYVGSDNLTYQQFKKLLNIQESLCSSLFEFKKRTDSTKKNTDRISYKYETSRKNLSEGDKLYLQYLYEKTFDSNMINCLFQNIIKLNKNVRMNIFSNTSEIATLMQCCKLPNIFTRHYFVQYAIDCLSEERDLGNNFYEYIFGDKFLAILTPDPYERTDFEKENKWLGLYSSYISFWADIAFPIFENYFLIYLLELFESTNYTLADTYKIMGKYLETKEFKKYTDIFKPVSDTNKKADTIASTLPEKSIKIIEPNFSFEQSDFREYSHYIKPMLKDEYKNCHDRNGVIHISREYFKTNIQHHVSQIQKHYFRRLLPSSQNDV